MRSIVGEGHRWGRWWISIRIYGGFCFGGLGIVERTPIRGEGNNKSVPFSPTGVVTTKAEMDALSLHPDPFRGEWNYELHLR